MLAEEDDRKVPEGTEWRRLDRYDGVLVCKIL